MSKVERLDIKDSLISFLDDQILGNETIAVNQYLQKYQNSSELNELLNVIDELEHENSENLDQAIFMSNNISECFKKPLEQINGSLQSFEKNFNFFQCSQERFNESYDIISKRLLPLIIIDRNIDLTKEIYEKLRIGLEEMDKFTKIFCEHEPNKDEIIDAVDIKLDKILCCNDYFQPQQNTSPDAITIFNQKIEQWESKIAHTFDVKRNFLDNYTSFFDKFDQKTYKNAKSIKESILCKLYDRDFECLFKYKNDVQLLTDKRKQEKFISDFFYSFTQILSSFPTKFQNIGTPNSYSEGIIQIFKDTLKKVMDFIELELHSNPKLSFSFHVFYDSVQKFMNVKNIPNEIKGKADTIFQPIREKCSNELIQQWEKEIKANITQSFQIYQNNPSNIFERTKKHAKTYTNTDQDEDSDTVSNTIYSLYQGKYIIQEVFEIIHHFETDYNLKLSNLYEANNPKFTELLIESSNLIVQYFNNIDISKIEHKRTTAFIIINSYHALFLVVSEFKRQKFDSKTQLLPLTKEYDHHGYMNLFISKNNFSSDNIRKFFQNYLQYLVTDSLRMDITALFAQRVINFMAKTLSSEPKEFNLSKNIQKLGKISKYSETNLKNANEIKKLCSKAIAFFQTPQNNTMNELINFCNKKTNKNLKSYLLKIINESQK